MLVHNHPSGELKPSVADKDITDRLIQVGIIVETQVLDHLIISDKSYLSFEDTGLTDELKKSSRYVPNYVLEQRIKKEAAQIAEQKKTLEIAKQLKRNGVDEETIAQSTELSLEEVKKLKVKKS